MLFSLMRLFLRTRYAGLAVVAVLGAVPTWVPVWAMDSCEGDGCPSQTRDESDCSRLRSEYKKVSKWMTQESRSREERIRAKEREIREIATSIPNLVDMILGYDARVRDSDQAEFRKLLAAGHGPKGWAAQVIASAREARRSAAKKSIYERQLKFFQNGVRQTMGADYISYLPVDWEAASRRDGKFDREIGELSRMKPQDLIASVRRTYDGRSKDGRAQLQSELASRDKAGTLHSFLEDWNEDLFVRYCVERSSSKPFCRGTHVFPGFGRIEQLRTALFAVGGMRGEQSESEIDARSDLRSIEASIERTDELMVASRAGSCKPPTP